MHEGINFGRVRTNSQCKIPKKKLNKPTLSRKINLKRLKHSQETVTGKNSKEKKTREFSSIKLIQVQVFHPSVLSFNEKVIGLAITVTYWLMWLYVTCVRQLVLTAWKHIILSLQDRTCADVWPLSWSRMLNQPLIKVRQSQRNDKKCKTYDFAWSCNFTSFSSTAARSLSKPWEDLNVDNIKMGPVAWLTCSFMWYVYFYALILVLTFVKAIWD